MSYRSSSHLEYQPHHSHDHGRAAHPRRFSSATVHKPSQPPVSQRGYTIAHAGKQVRLGPVVFWIVVGTVVLLGIWSAATATYFTFRDDVLTRLIGRQAQMQYAYEDRIAELRSRIDRTTSRQLLDQEQFNKKLDQIMRRQAVLESRAAALTAMPDAGVTGSIKGASRSNPAPYSTSTPKPSPISDSAIFKSPLDHQSRLEPGKPGLLAPRTDRQAKNQNPGDLLTHLESSLDRVESRQMAQLTSTEDRMESSLRRMRGLFADIGLNPSQMKAVAAHAGGVGGPYIPVKLRGGSDPFDRELYRVSLTKAQVDAMHRTLAYVPYRKPVVGEPEFTSGFGVRVDPFLGRPAMHTGLDFRASTGDPVRATADGKVVRAGWAGGYGRMVEIDHGNGLSTRYGHLSQINVRVGETIKIGQIVGEVGSTGRSTGPHLHYETRIDGQAVDPQKFLRAGAHFAAN